MEYVKKERILECVLTAYEAGRVWGINPHRVSTACTGFRAHGYNSPPRFTPEEARKVGRIWLVTIFGMERVFGKKKNF